MKVLPFLIALFLVFGLISGCIFQQTSTPAPATTPLADLSPTSLRDNPVSPQIQSTEAAAVVSLFDNFSKLNPKLGEELGKIPELEHPEKESAKALEKIYALLALSTNPEVKEAFELMLIGGTPSPNDYSYAVPNYNTELQVLYWIAEQNEFKKDDTLALSIAMVSGLWVTMGDTDVRETVYKDSNDLLNFFRETNELQKTKGYSQLEDYPLEAKVYLSWRGNDLGRGGHLHYQLMSGLLVPPSPSAVNIHIFNENKAKRISLGDYLWNNVDIGYLRKIRDYVAIKRLVSNNADIFAQNTESYFNGYKFTEPGDDWLVYRGEKTVNHNMNNANLEFDYLRENGQAIGVCDDEMTIVDAFLKSWGIPSGSMTRTYGKNHTHVFYYEPASTTWRAYWRQLDIGLEPKCNVYVFRPPAMQHNYYIYHQDDLQPLKMLNLYHKTLGVTGSEVKELFMKGAPSSMIKQWLFYE